MATRKREMERVWLSYDLGLRGNYEALYEWLDSKGAKECGDSLATFLSDRSNDELNNELEEILGTNSKVRVYLIKKQKGSFLLGKRKSAPWAGYFESAVESVLDQ